MRRWSVAVLMLAATGAFAQSGLPDAGFAYTGSILEQGQGYQGPTAMVGLNLWPPSGPGLCSMPASQVQVRDGRFTLLLSPDCSNAIVNNADFFVELVVNGSVLPRSPSRAVPAAARAGIAGRVSGTWQTATLQPGWQGLVRCRRLGDVVFITVNVVNPSVSFSGAAAQLLATLPNECRGNLIGVDPASSVSIGPGGGNPGNWASLAYITNGVEVRVACSGTTEASSFCSQVGQKAIVGTLINSADF